ncbi:hypothetical protein C8Q80DRAFT_678081 [Daedaleopsis nitida]|nr:hypothetical protein C8Q80DRAFT_678081 [Daedaleopsis nitida]
MWEDISLLIAVELEADDDPFLVSRTSRRERDLVRLTQNARNLMLAHGHLAAFSLGFYGETVRIAHFDHACVTVCKSFNVKKRPDLLQRFLWHFVHPVVGDTIVGCDLTVRRLTHEDKLWVKQCLMMLGNSRRLDATCDNDMRHGRRVLVPDELTGSHRWYVAYQPIDINASLFSRATTVWRAIEDTRDVCNGAKETALPRVRVLKDSWRMLARPSEVSFYQRLQSRIPAGERHGFAQLECGADLGQLEVREWEPSSPNASYMTGQRKLRLSLATHPSQPAASKTCSTSTSATTANHPAVQPGVSSTTSPSPPSAAFHDMYPLPFPQHQTLSWRITRGPEFAYYLERSHMRTVVSNVGRPITKFKNTRELVRAVRDAIIGHRQAFMLGGVLHRDVSVGNILIVDDAEATSLTGFLHDFDYSKLVEDIVSLSQDADVPDYPNVSDMTPEEYDAFFKWECAREEARPIERAGTFAFMAIDILKNSPSVATHKPVHDLESFYWVLLWVVPRHTSNALGKERCLEIFDIESDRAAAACKVALEMICSPTRERNWRRRLVRGALS